VVVVSAMGKTTNKLLAIAAAAIAGKRDEFIRQIHDLRDYHSREARQVVPLEGRAGLDRFLDEHFQELTELVKGLAVLGELTPRSVDAISSYGERLSSYRGHAGLPPFRHARRAWIRATSSSPTSATPRPRPIFPRPTSALPPPCRPGREIPWW
jgi:hypothetical protein